MKAGDKRGFRVTVTVYIREILTVTERELFDDKYESENLVTLSL